MKADLREYHPNGFIKRSITFYSNDEKYCERFYDEKGKLHNINAPALQYWYDNGFKGHEAYIVNDTHNNINNPAVIASIYVGKITWKSYYINDNNFDNKLTWLNKIKNIL
jgi:hypothetical protein